MSVWSTTQSETPFLTVELVKDTFQLIHQRHTLQVSQKWSVFYTLLAIHSDRHISTDEICDHHPWSRLSPDVAGRDLWRFTRSQELKLFGTRISGSPARQSTKLFTLLPQYAAQVQFLPDRTTVADQLRSLRQHRNAAAMEISECTLMLQSGLVDQALARLRQLKDGNLNVNDQAHIETMITMCLDEYNGVKGTAQQVPVLEQLLESPGLNRINRARLLIRLARHATLSAHYISAQQLFALLRPMLAPEDGVEYCWYHVNYGLYLRRVGRLEEAIHHQRLAHDVAQIAQWWHGVYASRYNLALMHLTAAEQSPVLARQRHLQQGLEWAMRAYDTAVLTRQPLARTDTALLLSSLQRRLGNYAEARHWLSYGGHLNPDQPAQPSDHPHPRPEFVYGELALLEEASGNHFLAQVARQHLQQLKRQPSVAPEDPDPQAG